MMCSFKHPEKLCISFFNTGECSLLGSCPDRHPVQVCVRYLNGTCLAGLNCVHQHPVNQNGIYKSQAKPQPQPQSGLSPGSNASRSSPTRVKPQPAAAFFGPAFGPNQMNQHSANFIPGSARHSSEGSDRRTAGQTVEPSTNQSPAFIPGVHNFSAGQPTNQSPGFIPGSQHFSAGQPTNQGQGFHSGPDCYPAGAPTNHQNQGNQFGHPAQMMGQGWHL